MRSLVAAAAPLARPAAGARARISKRMVWHASSLQAGSKERAGGSVTRVESCRNAVERVSVGGVEALAAHHTVGDELGNGECISARRAEIVHALLTACDETICIAGVRSSPG